MPTPSFDELLARARQIGEAEADRSRVPTGLLAAKGASEFVSNLLNTQVSPRRTTGGYVTPGGQFGAVPESTRGGTFLQTLADRVAGPSPTMPAGAIPLSPEQTGEFGMRMALENVKGQFRLKTADLRAKAQKAVSGARIAATTQPMAKEASDYVWALTGRDPETETLPILSFGDADRILRAKGIDTTAELKGLGYEISIFKDPLFGIPDTERGRLAGKAQGAGKSKATGKSTEKTIRVKLKSTGETGTIPANEFDSNTYERI